MSDQPAKPTGKHEPGTYEIRLGGHLDARWAKRLDVSSLAHEAAGTTLLRGIVADQAALHGLLHRIRDLGLPLISVVRIDPTRLSIATQREKSMSTNVNKSQPNAASIIRWSGLAAIAGGLIFAGIQPIHPADYLSSVTTGTWAAFMYAKLAMCLFFLVGITAIYSRQANRAGWLGLFGFALLIATWFLQSVFIFTEGFILPVAAGVAPQLVESFLTLANGTKAVLDIGPAAAVYAIAGLCYMLGGLLFGIATVRAGVLPKWAGILLAVAAVVTPAAALLPHELQRLAGIPVGLAIAWLGYGVWSVRQSIPAEVGLGQAAR